MIHNKPSAAFTFRNTANGTSSSECNFQFPGSCRTGHVSTRHSIPPAIDEGRCKSAFPAPFTPCFIAPFLILLEVNPIALFLARFTIAAAGAYFLRQLQLFASGAAPHSIISSRLTILMLWHAAQDAASIRAASMVLNPSLPLINTPLHGRTGTKSHTVVPQCRYIFNLIWLIASPLLVLF